MLIRSRLDVRKNYRVKDIGGAYVHRRCNYRKQFVLRRTLPGSSVDRVNPSMRTLKPQSNGPLYGGTHW